VAWKIGKGNHVRLGEDPWIGATDNYILSPDLRAQLRAKGLTKLADVKKEVAFRASMLAFEK
jgi:hypothetical protein